MTDHMDLTLYSTPEAIPALISFLNSHSRIFIDTEVADWATENPRLSLIQITSGDGRSHIIDVLAPGMKETVEGLFIPAIMQNPSIESGHIMLRSNEGSLEDKMRIRYNAH